MVGLQETFARLSSQRWQAATPPSARLEPFAAWGANPGALLAKAHIPVNLPGKSPLVVVLHGCTQNAEAYDYGSGWSQLADELGFAVLYPEQQRANNANLCFNWFEPGDVSRGKGEVASIRAMINTLVDTYDLDKTRVFVTGLSAGGAMTTALLAAYPEVFAGGAVIGGLPAGSATSVPQALQQMRRPSKVVAGAVRARSRFAGSGPTISIWHGEADHVVSSANASEIAEQWRDFHGASSEGVSGLVDGHRHTVWRDARGRAVVEQFSIGGMGHGVPLATGGSDQLGTPGAYMLDAGISSTRHIARFWGLHIAAPRAASAPQAVTPAPIAHKVLAPTGQSTPRSTPGEVIENALRAAGLMR